MPGYLPAESDKLSYVERFQCYNLKIYIFSYSFFCIVNTITNKNQYRITPTNTSSHSQTKTERRETTLHSVKDCEKFVVKEGGKLQFRSPAEEKSGKRCRFKHGFSLLLHLMKFP